MNESDYDYLNSRVRGMSANLLNREFYNQALNSADRNMVVDVLLGTTYRDEIQEEFTIRKGIHAVESAFRRHLFKVFEKVMAIADGAPRKILEIQMLRWDFECIRTVIRGKAVKKGKQEIMKAMLPAGVLHEKQMEELASQEDISAVIDLLVTWKFRMSGPISDVIRKHLSPLDLEAIEISLDSIYFQWALEQLTLKNPNVWLFKDFIRQQIDLKNILLAVRIVRRRERKEETDFINFIPGGKIKISIINRISNAHNLEEAFTYIDETYFARAIEKGILAFGERRQISEMERFLEIVIIENGCKMFRIDSLGIGVALGFIWKKFNEFINLRIILRGKEYGMPANRIREELLLV